MQSTFASFYQKDVIHKSVDTFSIGFVVAVEYVIYYNL